MYEVILPDAGEGTVESEIITWFYEIGDEVKEDDILLEMQSDKAVVELPSPVNGTLKEILYQEGELAQVGEPVVIIDTGEGSNEEPAEEQASAVDQTETADEPIEKAFTSTTSTTEVSDDWRTLAVPRVRIYARNNDVDLTQVTGTGNNGKITIEDIDKYLEDPQAQETTKTETPEKQEEQTQEPVEVVQPTELAQAYEAEEVSGQRADRVEKITPMRRAVANAMVNSKQISPHVTVFDEVEVSALVDHRNEMKEIAAGKEVHLTYTAYFVKALVAMLKRFPDLNASMNLSAGEIYYHQYYNIGVAVDTPQGLMVPILKDADRLSLFEIAEKVTELSGKATDGEITTNDMKHGSMTVTNVGGAATGGVWSTPIINQPEIAIVGMGRIEDKFLPDEEGNPVLKPTLKISFAFDHRAVDGVYAQQALNLLKEYLNNPNLLLSEG